ncbi:B3 domain-containing protein [Cardamine amara subsp. amara]|uniref:B3 domain-containing protein n=1 Tax=Cardamine amara subsp. amara TaxID=228776 RepID=A0ABD1C488_CARAN
MLPESVTLSDKIQANVSKPSFFKSLSPGENWKSQSMRMIPEEFVRSTPGAFEHRVVCSVRWGNSWQLWLERDKNGLLMIEEDWNGFVDHNLLSPNDCLLFTHEDDMFLEVRIFKNNADEVMTSPLDVEPETETVHPNPPNFHQATTAASTSFSAVGGNTNGRVRQVTINNPERYLLNPASPFFVKTLTKKNDVLYMRQLVIQTYHLRFGAHNSPITYILPQGNKEEGLTKIYGGVPCFNGWTAVCRKYNLQTGDVVVCELERSGGIVTAVRLHFVNE